MASTFLEMCQIAHFTCRKDIATKLRLEQLTRKYKQLMSGQMGSNSKVAKDLKALDHFTGQSRAPGAKGGSDVSDVDEAIQSKFIEIRDVDVNSEVMDL